MSYNCIQYYTTAPRTDGFGAQFQNIIADILYIYNNTNHAYVFPNIASFEHNYTNEPRFTERLVQYMNLRSHFRLPSNVSPNEVKCISNGESYPFVESNLSRLLKSQTMTDIKIMFYEGITTPFDRRYHNVAVHIRRYNIVDTRIAGTDTPHSYYIGLMNHIRATHGTSDDKRPLRFHIYSQTTSADTETVFKQTYCGNDDTELHLNGDVIPAFHGMVFADALICSGSSLSYCAAFLCNGNVYYKRFWHRPADFWLIGDDILKRAIIS
ncbi:MAG: hypothetical protein EBU66_18975 [Bacteroidetes bacterium]|nr:hypothetical protein [bacterium]NBP66717.1 hypothetical protein [Bacteroidota bacterium]